MRQTGLIDTVDGLGRQDHVCWVFDSPDEYRPAAERFLAEALAGGQRVLFVGGADQVAQVSGAAWFAAGLAAGAAHVHGIGFYADAGLFDPLAQVRAYAQATEAALADGYTGLRVAVDATPLVETDAGRDAFARYEHLADAYMTSHPMSAMCAFDRSRLGAGAVAELACMHPLARAAATPVRLFASAEPGLTAVLEGEVDLASYPLLRTALDRIPLRPVDGVVTLDARRLAFIDHRSLLSLAAQLRARGAETRLIVAAGSGLPRLLALLPVAGPDVVVQA
ncbi:MEDS domain-containing protein [Dactylosporangium vinaceum]|uniref:MEDS domain-containing protein n=1 Tax=Dactylosporangium vinaceum TaxID=53362 RepID=A0ABV5MAQ8_9ACTN|nr:MEDS domain-containing protein [Dactylosporangium vinaceum]UAB92899.1 MEDS domain-containing protein [Dactylosporangium vinaceum]